MDAAGAWGSFSESNICRAISHAVAAVKTRALRDREEIDWPPFTINAYTFRHTFAADLYQARGDLALVQAYIGHVAIRMTRRYAKRAVLNVLRAGVADLERFRDGASARVLPFGQTSGGSDR